jgi:hypothetical protein
VPAAGGVGEQQLEVIVRQQRLERAAQGRHVEPRRRRLSARFDDGIH